MKNIFLPCFCTLLTGLLLSLSACEEATTTLDDTRTVVVEGYLYAGEPVDHIEITLSNPYTESSDSVFSLDATAVYLSDGTTTHLLDPIGNGRYQNLNVFIEPANNYSLEFVYEEQTISAVTYIPDTTSVSISSTEIYLQKIEFGTVPNFGTIPDPIELTWDNTTGDYYYVVVENVEDDPEYVNEILASEEVGGRFQFVSEPQVMDFYSIDPRREIQQFGWHQVIVFRVNPEYAALYESVGNTSTSLSEPQTNINNGLGIFTGVSSDTLWLEVIKQ